MLPRYGVTDARFVDLVRYHDVNLSWHIAAMRGDPPTDKAWRKMSGRLDMRELTLFMVADREDCPGGFRENAPLMWFLEEVQRRGLVDVASLVLDVTDDDARAPELCAGALVVRESARGAEVLVIDQGRGAFELPKGHLETGEGPEQAAIRELKEESGVIVPAGIGTPLALRTHSFRRRDVPVVKYVYFARFACRIPTERGAPTSLRERRWVTAGELDALPLVAESLRSLIIGALS
jgi:ADP-ribose pyrophosphatase YjhB (NUDIX family)